MGKRWKKGRKDDLPLRGKKMSEQLREVHKLFSLVVQRVGGRKEEGGLGDLVKRGKKKENRLLWRGRRIRC